MHIGGEHNCFQITKKVATLSQITLHIETKVVGAGWLGWVFAHPVQINSDQAAKGIQEFVSLQSNRLDLALSDGGCFRVRRRVNGQIIFRYRLAHLHLGAAMEGEIVLDADRAGDFCKELRSLIAFDCSGKQPNRSISPPGPQ